ncbi:MAG: tRNA epoxyqueuosine(34) reductase QueG [Bacteroidaceae bacterium]|jgi:epoxyqueuosine reductase
MDESAQLLKKKIEAEAARLGFSACGVARVDEPDAAVLRRYDEWVSSGACAGMDYMRRYVEVRRQPALLLPGARSMVCVALPYAPSRRLPADVPQISCYAYGEDYHEAIRRRLHALLAFVREACAPQPVAGRACVDTAPLFEKYWAARAGIGWVGRHTQLILPGKGSAHFLGELLLDVDLPPDEPLRGGCGRCRRCIDACPTGALRLRANGVADGAPALLDARLCLSCQTIEFRGEVLPDAVKKAMGGRIYGCDECQKACPHNRGVEASTVPEFALSDELAGMTLADWRRLTPKGFRRLFRRSAVRRAGYEALMRNLRAAFPDDAEG